MLDDNLIDLWQVDGLSIVLSQRIVLWPFLDLQVHMYLIERQAETTFAVA